MNLVVLQGNLGQQAEIKQSTGGNSYAKFSIAVNDYVKKQKKTTWFNCVAFGKTAEYLVKVAKGTSILVKGRIEINKVEDKYYTNIIVDQLQAFGKSEKQKELDIEDKSGQDDIPF